MRPASGALAGLRTERRVPNSAVSPFDGGVGLVLGGPVEGMYGDAQASLLGRGGPMSGGRDCEHPEDELPPHDPVFAFLGTGVLWGVPAIWLFGSVMRFLPNLAILPGLLAVFILMGWKAYSAAFRAQRAQKLWYENQARRSLSRGPQSLPERADGRGDDIGDRPTLMHGSEHDSSNAA